MRGEAARRGSAAIADRLVCRLLWHELAVSGDDEVVGALDGLLPRAEHPMPARRAMTYEVRRAPDGFEVLEEGDAVATMPTSNEARDLLYIRAHRRAFEWASLAGWVRVHAATVDLDGVRVVLVGRSGSGKSTLALRLLLDGAAFQGDESVLVRRGTSLAVPRPLFVKAGYERFAPELAALAPGLPRTEEALIVDPGLLGPPWRLRQAPVDHFVLLDDRPGPPGCQPAERAELLEALLHDTFLFLETKSKLVATLAPVVADGRTHRLHRTDPAAMVLALREALG